MSRRPLTTTSFAILGLLAIQPWATYELAQLMKRSLHFVWPRAESNLYAEPKRLVEGGYALATEEWNGHRKRTIYAITPKGRDALRRWLGEPPAGQRLESEAALRILYGNLGSKADLLAAVARVATDAEDAIEHFRRLGDEYARGEGRFPGRIHVNALLLTLMVEQARAAACWAEWATAEIERWDGTETPDVEWAARTMQRWIDDEDSVSDAP
jgi:PadR family transcriptional regulator, regulatory protein AphA